MNSRQFKKSAGVRAWERGENILTGFPLCLAIIFFALQSATPALAQGLSTVDDYASRLNRAVQAVNEVIKQENPAPELAIRMNAIKRLLPASEEVEFNGSVIHVDNAWLHEDLNNVIENARGDIEQRHSMLSEISDRLANLQRSVKESQNTKVQASQDQRARLDNILARSEYQPEEKRESTLQRWGRKIKNFILRLLERIFGGSSARTPQTSGAGLVAVFRILIILAVIAALIFGAVKLALRLERRRRPEEEVEAREVLGEEIAEDVTAADLFANASELAQQGEYRKAIRRVYIALLCDLEHRGKLRLSRSKTNRDYMDAMRSEPQMYPAFSSMTSAFEHVWYGQDRATAEEFRNFAALYQETVR